MPRLFVVLEDRRLAEVRAMEQAGDWPAAAHRMDAVLGETRLSADQRCTWDYTAGRIHLAAHDHEEASAAFERVLVPREGEAPCAIAPYAAWRDAEALVAAGRYDRAIARALSIGDGFASRDEVERLLATAYAGLGDGGPAPFSAALARSPQAEPMPAARESSPATTPTDVGATSRSPGEPSCPSAIAHAQGIPHGKPAETADAWGVAIARCVGSEALATALYYGGKASASAHRPAEAAERFSRVEKLFPRHRLADDARLRGALVALDQGDEARANAMLSSLPDDYPDGDMRGEALFRIALGKMRARDFDAAQRALDRAIATGLEDTGGSTAGRSAYFRGRVSELSGDLESARERYATLVREQPLSYYMLLAWQRLAATDADGARALLSTVTRREPSGPFLTRIHPEYASLPFVQFQLLLDVGEIDAARRLAAASGLAAENADSEVLWTIAWLLNRSGAFESAYGMTRTRLSEYRHHYPSGRWRLAWEVAYPRAWNSVVEHESETAHIPAALTWAVMREESGYDPVARSPANALGLMQLLPTTARGVARDASLPFGDDALLRPETCIFLGARYLSVLRGAEGTSPALAIAAYNAGAGAVRRWLTEFGSDDFDVFVERIPYDETRTYIKRVLASEAAYAFMTSPESFEEVIGTMVRRSP
ncbi:MAG: transglycosylase SLT domain-containing protein [Polyangiaceae bacterium]|jgi:soluble lytic murein transglycosylase